MVLMFHGYITRREVSYPDPLSLGAPPSAPAEGHMIMRKGPY